MSDLFLDEFARYVGSPYQTSLSEAGEKKYLYCLRREPQNGMEQNVKCLWKEKDRWPIDIGRKYIKVIDNLL